MRSSRKALIIILVVGIGIFGYTQYASASQIGVKIVNSQLADTNEQGKLYNLELEFDNPSLLILSTGETEFVITADEKRLGQGNLDPFVLPSMSKTRVSGTFTVDSEIDSDSVPTVRINGVTKYNIIVTTVDVPFEFYPTEQQASEFIHQN